MYVEGIFLFEVIDCCLQIIHLFVSFLFLDKHKRPIKDKRAAKRFGSFYLRVGAVAFGIGSMVYSGLEIGQYFNIEGKMKILLHTCF